MIIWTLFFVQCKLKASVYGILPYGLEQTLLRCHPHLLQAASSSVCGGICTLQMVVHVCSTKAHVLGDQ